MDTYSLLDELEQLIDEGFKIPLTGKVVVDWESILQCIDTIRTQLPEEMRQARWITKERERIIDEARQEAQRLLEEGRQKVQLMAQESQVVREANIKAEEVVAQARKVAQEIRIGAEEYADSILEKLETKMEEAIQVVRSGRQQLQNRSPQENNSAVS